MNHKDFFNLVDSRMEYVINKHKEDNVYFKTNFNNYSEEFHILIYDSDSRYLKTQKCILELGKVLNRIEVKDPNNVRFIKLLEADKSSIFRLSEHNISIDDIIFIYDVDKNDTSIGIFYYKNGGGLDEIFAKSELIKDAINNDVVYYV